LTWWEGSTRGRALVERTWRDDDWDKVTTTQEAFDSAEDARVGCDDELVSVAEHDVAPDGMEPFFAEVDRALLAMHEVLPIRQVAQVASDWEEATDDDPWSVWSRSFQPKSEATAHFESLL